MKGFGVVNLSENSQSYMAFRLLTIRLLDIIKSLDSLVIGKEKEKETEVIPRFLISGLTTKVSQVYSLNLDFCF